MRFPCVPFILIMFSALSTECTSNRADDIELPLISFSSSYFQVVEDVLFDTLVDSPEYVILETRDECLIANVAGVTVTSKEILIITRGRVLVFGRDGHFITQLGSEGRGPEEYLNPLNVLYDEITGIYTIYGYMNIVQFNKEKEYIKRLKLGSDLKRMYQINSELFVSELKTEPYYGDSVVYSLEFFNSEFEPVYKHKTSEPTNPVAGHLFIVDLMGNINCGKGGMLFRETYGDTIYTIDENMSVKPLLALDFGGEKYPKELDFNANLWSENRGKYIDLGKFAIVDNLFVSQFTINGSSRYAITDIHTNKTIVPFNSECDKHGFVLSAFPGYNFRPIFIDGYLANVILPTDALEYLDRNTDAVPEDIKRKILELNESDNPLLILGAGFQIIPSI